MNETGNANLDIGIKGAKPNLARTGIAVIIIVLLCIALIFALALMMWQANFKLSITIMKHEMDLIEKHEEEKKTLIAELKNRDELAGKQEQIITEYEKLFEAQKENLKRYKEKDQKREEERNEILEAQQKEGLKVSRLLQVTQADFIAFQKDRIKDMDFRIKRQKEGLDEFELRHNRDLNAIDNYKQMFDRLDREQYAQKLIGVLENPEKLYQHTLKQIQRIRFIQIYFGERMAPAKD